MIALALLLTLAADDLTPEKAAKVQKDRDQAMADVSKKYGNKKSSELTSDERREMIKDQRAAETNVLEKNNVDAKEFARYEAKMNLSDRAATKAARENLDKKEAEDKKAADDKQGNGEIPIQRGFNENNPVTLEEKPQNTNGAPVVEKGLPPDAQQDQSEASGGNAPANDYDSAPAKKSGKGKK
jgi:hypothetical protein